ncbi:hypothetical protein [Schaalia sp. ZJ1691]|uniref:hypothetical protein n=1 Tax=Schaalia sp. ZJ1691 TaxID=2709404 RepID=UPI0013EB734F|nr:hypothetical protein [Schaalia sp. ZJ1691]
MSIDWVTIAAAVGCAGTIAQALHWMYKRFSTEDEGHLVLDAGQYPLVYADGGTREWTVTASWQGEGRCWDIEVLNPQGLRIDTGQTTRLGVLLPGDSLDIHLTLEEPEGSLDFRYRPHGKQRSRTDRIYLPGRDLSVVSGSASWRHRARLARRSSSTTQHDGKDN